ncbi:CaiB/BaiF CoA transferase family protein [Microbacterium sp. A93]|uniref:CaiB/BaiF CoA transferase family protein n=1 Tax=Microbacterium sp. A93 TaxID=3450716 RepID=UPI003F429221
MTLVNWRPLDGVTVVDFTRMAPGGTGTLLLADLGATVHKIEHPTGGDDTRHLKPKVGADSSAQHQYMDRGKHSVRADLKQQADLALVRSLVADADAVIESFRPGVAARLGIGFHDLAAINPSLVYVSLSGYGQSGPRAATAGHDLNFVGYAGLLGETVPRVLQADVTGGILAALAIVSGVARARQDGTPAHVDLSLADAALALGGMQVVEALAARSLDVEVETPLNGQSPCYQIYRCADGRSLAVAAIEPKFWQRTLQLLGREEWLVRQHDPTLISEFGAVIATEPQAHWVEILVEDDTCVSPVLDPQDVSSDSHILERGALCEYDSVAGPLWQVASPFRNLATIPAAVGHSN